MFATFLFGVFFVALSLFFAEPTADAETMPEQPTTTEPAAPIAPIIEPVRIAARAATMTTPIAKTTITTEPTKTTAATPKTVKELRQLCTARRVKWRDAKGKNKHLTKSEMIAALP